MIVKRDLACLVRPGDADDYFVTPPGSFVCSAQFHPANAYWLGEIAHLIYREDAAVPAREDFLRRVGLDEVEHFDNAGTQASLIDSGASWPERVTILAFRGSSELSDWVTNLTALSEPWPAGGRVHQGFKQALERVWPVVHQRLLALDPRNLFICGHSLGAALATLAASLIAPPLRCSALYTFGSPRVGDEEFVAQLERAAFPIYRIVNEQDVVARVPAFIGVHPARHAGQLLSIAPEGGLAPPGSSAPAPDNGLIERLRGLSSALVEGSAADDLLAHAPVNYVLGLR